MTALGPSLAASSRAVFSASALTLTMAPPAGAIRGDVLVAIVCRGNSDAAAPAPAGWTLAAGNVGGGIRLDVYTRAMGDNEPVVFRFTTKANEWQGMMLAIRPSSPAIALEGSAFAAVSAATSLPVPGVNCQQATNLIVGVWSGSGAPTLTPPSDFTLIDKFATAMASNRSLMIGYRIAGATGPLTFGAAASSSASTSGGTFALVVRDRVPPKPVELFDPVPGNIGLIGKDTRPAR